MIQPANLFSNPSKVPNQFIAEVNGVSIYLKREDLLHPEVSGNKFRKLKYNINEATSQKRQILLTFGGAFSNHISATAAAGKLAGFKTIGVIRGEELGKDLEKTLQENPTLRFAHACGMEFHFISRSDYREKTSEVFIEDLRKKFGDFYLVPEGGTNELAVKGCEEILLRGDAEFDVICCAVGTGGTISGIINASEEHQQILGFPALKGDFLKPEIARFSKKNNWDLITNYHFGGYAKVDRELITFINTFRSSYGVQLDPVYTGKMLYGIFDLAREGYFLKNTRILAIHTGGLQGISGMNKVLEMKNLPTILM
ncbi:1-aminocyclopropane-1-carboxylate deaminase/D-cysteine desulfhydrase [Salinimicrobium tongyeongense]|uniref:1-aminocyclopropane-1-carboxylate deaminase/D-cysteine desulfhydrase n=1 Tax=Salinimicrobium tongyeongense TaxID=2809707 RepID=A0ABY6NTG3_9FLAO|nr:pyridoxal-phosphate dependent enzyme [Salinimicrobium tongyeongense]UZH56209.1 1-aminocyclopropane-1-carboxylate deaminase/D-cysteine desulfhydrase [Salinimicrobium tongyeongense]